LKKIVSVFGPSEVQPRDKLYDAAERLGSLLFQKGFAVLTGGYEGVMEAAAKGANKSGGGALAVTAEVYYARGREVNPYITKEVRVKSAVDRLMELIDLADACIAIGNSPGTFTEVLTVWDYTKKKFIRKRPMILVGEEWEKVQLLFSSQKHFRGQDEFLTYVPTIDGAVQLLEEHFGLQPLLPDLNIIKI